MPTYSRAVDEHRAHARRVYANWLAVGVRIGFVALVASFVIYVTSIVPPGIRLVDLPRLWGLPVAQYVAATGAPTGWGWVRRLGESDLLNFVGVAILGSLSGFCYARVLLIFVRARDGVIAAICLAQIIVLLFVASGLFVHG